MMLEEVKDGYNEEIYEIIIDRSMLLDESFHYIVDEDPALLRGNLLMQFKHEKDAWPGVLREWFFLDISLEDIWDIDPTLYSSCKQILKMDPETVYQDILCLTFVNDVEEMVSRITIDLCPNGKDILVNSKNRKQVMMKTRLNMITQEHIGWLQHW
ncbi:hypothetical protein EJD97_011800 [Solanum chilense]|uniref:HECT-type E3 ubiquitin transferase n=1 Tax=Solanum chilense TaxID=4083 RepID=A0A6N2AI72_SOLCI|nr:hypothetical protein EJD97_011800 [Solanum chilense]